jgi:hypothetical protein
MLLDHPASSEIKRSGVCAHCDASNRNSAAGEMPQEMGWMGQANGRQTRLFHRGLLLQS